MWARERARLVAIRGERIAYVGLRDDMVGPRTELIDASGCTLGPGYIEPHAHPWNLAPPAALARHVLPLGTTTLFGDNLTAYELGGLRGFETAADFRPAGPAHVGGSGAASSGPVGPGGDATRARRRAKVVPSRRFAYILGRLVNLFGTLRGLPAQDADPAGRQAGALREETQ